MAGFICQDELINAVVFMESKPQWSYNVWDDYSMRFSTGCQKMDSEFGDSQV